MTNNIWGPTSLYILYIEKGKTVWRTLGQSTVEPVFGSPVFVRWGNKLGFLLPKALLHKVMLIAIAFKPKKKYLKKAGKGKKPLPCNLSKRWWDAFKALPDHFFAGKSNVQGPGSPEAS